MALAVAALVVLAVLSLLARFAGWRRAVFIVLAVLAVLIGGLALRPVGLERIVSHPAPAADYAAAVAIYDADLAPAPQPLNPLCEPALMSHGGKTDRVVVLIHGLSSCARAFVDFAPAVFATGANVLVARMPHHGYADRAADALSQITAEELAAFGDRVVDAAAGLGDEVVVLGISGGGTVTGFLAQTRADVDRAVLVAPFFGLGGTDRLTNSLIMRAMLTVPDISIWKDPALRERFTGGMAHAYVRQSTRGTGELLRLAAAVTALAAERAPAAGEIAVATNAADTAVSNAVTDHVVALWAVHGADLVTTLFPAEHGLGHELIDPEEPGADPALTYPVLLALVNGSFDDEVGNLAGPDDADPDITGPAAAAPPGAAGDAVSAPE